MAQAPGGQQQQQNQQQQSNQQQNQQQQKPAGWWQTFMANGKPRRTDNVQHDQNPNSPQQQNNNGQQQQNNQSQQQQKSPFDGYEELFNNAPTDENKRPEFAIGGDVIKRTADSLDFTADLPPELMEQINGMGDQGKLMLQIAQHMSRGAYRNSIDHGTKLTDRYIGSHYDTYNAKGQQRTMQQHSALTGLRGMEAFHHPVVGKLLHPIATKLVDQYPDAPPEWVQKETLRLFNEANRMVNSDQYGQGNNNQQEDTKQAGGLDFDWKTWLNEGQNNNGQNQQTPFVQQQNQQQNFN